MGCIEKQQQQQWGKCGGLLSARERESGIGGEARASCGPRVESPLGSLRRGINPSVTG